MLCANLWPFIFLPNQYGTWGIARYQCILLFAVLTMWSYLLGRLCSFKNIALYSQSRFLEFGRLLSSEKNVLPFDPPTTEQKVLWTILKKIMLFFSLKIEICLSIRAHQCLLFVLCRHAVIALSHEFIVVKLGATSTKESSHRDDEVQTYRGDKSILVK